MEKEFSQEEIQHMFKAACQRAALMGLITTILESEEEGFTLLDLKMKIAGMFSQLIDMDMMVQDFIDLETIRVCQEVVEQEQAIKEAKDLLG